LEDSLLKHFPKEIKLTEERIEGYRLDMARYEQYKTDDFPGMTLRGVHYTEKKDAGEAIIEACKAQITPEAKEIGNYRGFLLLLSYDLSVKTFRLTLKGALSHSLILGDDIHGNIQRIENVLDSLSKWAIACETTLVDLQEQMANAKTEIDKPFAQEDELQIKSARLAELDALLNMDKKQSEELDAEPDNDQTLERIRDDYTR
jgi:hypothetical protein